MKEAMSGWSSIINANEQDLQKLKSAINNSTQSMQFWKKSMEDAGMSAKEVEKNLEYLDSIYEECKLTSDSLGLATSDLGLAISLLGKDSKVTSDDVNKLLDSILKMNDPTKEAQAIMEKYGVSIKRNEDNSINFSATLDTLRKSLKGKNEEQQKSILADMGLGNSTNELLEVLKLSDTEYEKLKTNLQETKGLTEKLAETMDQATMGSIKSMTSAISDTLIEAFNMVKPHIVDFANIIGESAKRLKTEGLANAVNYMVNEVGEKLSNLPQLATNAIGYFLDAIQQTFPNILELGGHIVLSLAEGIINNEQKIADTVSVVVGNIANWITNNFDTIIRAGNSIIDAIQQGMQDNQVAIGQAVDTFINGTTTYFLNKKTSFIKIGIDVVGGIIIGAIRGLNEKIGEWTQGLSDFFLRPFDLFSGGLADKAFNNGKMVADKSGEGLDTSKLTFSEKFSAFMKHGLNWKEEYGSQAKQTGEKTGDNVAKGIESKKGAVGSASDHTFQQALIQATSKLDQLSPETAGALNEVCQEILNSASRMYNGAKTSFSMLGKASKEAMSDMFTGIRSTMQKTQQMVQQISTNTYLQSSKSWQKLSQSAKQSMSDMYNGVTRSSSQMASKVIADWNRIRSALRGTITGNVQIKVHGVQSALNQINSVRNAARHRSYMPNKPKPPKRFVSFAAMPRNFTPPNPLVNFATMPIMPTNSYMRTRDVLRSNDISSFASSQIPSYINVNLGKKENKKKSNGANSQNINVEVKIDKFENKTNNSPNEIADKVIDRVVYKLQREKFAMGGAR